VLSRLRSIAHTKIFTFTVGVFPTKIITVNRPRKRTEIGAGILLMGDAYAIRRRTLATQVVNNALMARHREYIGISHTGDGLA
jgi:hypothetical protein